MASYFNILNQSTCSDVQLISILIRLQPVGLIEYRDAKLRNLGKFADIGSTQAKILFIINNEMKAQLNTKDNDQIYLVSHTL